MLKVNKFDGLSAEKPNNTSFVDGSDYAENFSFIMDFVCLSLCGSEAIINAYFYQFDRTWMVREFQSAE